MEYTPVIESTSLYFETALDAGLKLCRDAIWDGDRCNWVGANVAPVGGRYSVVRNACGPEVYGGLSGIAIFLGYLSNYVKEPLLDITLEGCMKNVLDTEWPAGASHFAYFGGKLGVADALITLGKLKSRADWTQAGEEMLAEVTQAEFQDTEIDIIGGAAGSIPVLLKHYRRSGDQACLDAAIRGAEFLLAKTIKSDQYWTWETMPGSPGLTGYSHGNAGIALAFLELWQVTKEAKYQQAGMMGMQYERIHFSPKDQNWPDMRSMPGQPNRGHVCATAWCHGAPGIALSRLRAWKLTGDQSYLSEAQTALRTTQKNNMTANTNYSLCHGIAGNADVLLYAGTLLKEPHWVQAAQAAGNQGIESILKNRFDWPAGVSDPAGGNQVFKNPSLMLGLAGTGYFYLRLAHPEEVPSVLLLSSEV